MNKELVKKKKYYILMYTLICMFLVGLSIIFKLFLESYNIWLNTFVIINYIYLFITIFIFRKINFQWLSLAGFFYIFIYCFHFGQLLTYSFRYESNRVTNFIEHFNNVNMQHTLIYVFCVLVCTTLGMLLVKDGEPKLLLKYIPKTMMNCKKEHMFQLALVMLVFSLPVKVYTDMIMVWAGILGSYLDGFEMETPGILSDIGNIVYIPITLLFLINDDKRQRAYLLISILFYSVFSMLGGGRGQQVLFLLLLGCLIVKKVYKPKWKHIIILVIIGAIGINFLNTLAETRIQNDLTLVEMIRIFLVRFKHNPYFEILTEIGGTIQTPYLIVEQVPKDIPYGYGMTFYKPIVTILPNVGGVLNELLKDINFMWKIDGLALGGSYAGELYYNFGDFGILIAPFVGYFVKKCSNIMKWSLQNQEYLIFIVFVPVFMNIIWWARSTFSPIVRPFVWGVLTLYLSHVLLLQYKKIKKEKLNM